MKLCYSERLRSNYLLIENTTDRYLTVEHIVRTARMHRAARVKGGKTLIAVAFVQSDGTREPERLLQEFQLSVELGRLTSVA